MKQTPEIDARIRQLEAEQKVLIRLLTEKQPAKAKAPKTPEPEPEEPDSRLVVGAKVTWKAQESRDDGGWYSTGPRIPFDQTTVGEIMSVTKKGDLRVEFLKRNPVTDTDTSSHDIKPNMLEFVE